MLIIGIAGGTGSGKTTVVRKIKNLLKEEDVAVISQDSYYKDSSHLTPEQKAVNNFDHPNSIDWDLLVSDLAKLRSGQAIESPVYSYITCSRSTTETVHVEPATIIIVEGILIFTNEELRKLFDISIFVDADADDRLGRVIQRDIEERGKTIQQVLKRYQETVKPMHLQFIEPSKRYADIIVPQGGHNRVAISIIIATIEKALLTRGE
ncbi:MAG: uridine kinase [Bacteroidales bacterium]|nr:uridine kinase [Bacteroidales bacterium]MBR2135362.1 uridine kinase [Bacteroidales bacterium]